MKKNRQMAFHQLIELIKNYFDAIVNLNERMNEYHCLFICLPNFFSFSVWPKTKKFGTSKCHLKLIDWWAHLRQFHVFYTTSKCHLSIVKTTTQFWKLFRRRTFNLRAIVSHESFSTIIFAKIFTKFTSKIKLNDASAISVCAMPSETIRQSVFVYVVFFLSVLFGYNNVIKSIGPEMHTRSQTNNHVPEHIVFNK